MNIERKVSRAAIMLDLYDPDWARRLRYSYIDLGSNDYCVIGLSFGNYIRSPEAQRVRRFLHPLWRLRVRILTPRPFFYLRRSAQQRAGAAWHKEIAARNSRTFDDRARVLRKRNWVTPAKTEEKAPSHVTVRKTSSLR